MVIRFPSGISGGEAARLSDIFQGFGVQFGIHLRLVVILQRLFLGFPVGGAVDADGLEMGSLLRTDEGHPHQFQEGQERHDDFLLGPIVDKQRFKCHTFVFVQRIQHPVDPLGNRKGGDCDFDIFFKGPPAQDLLEGAEQIEHRRIDFPPTEPMHLISILSS